ncbi:hypothetical protein MRX96_018475 [Rhipicephalus microplus]
MASCPTGGAAVVTTFDDNVAAVVPTNVPKKGDHRSEKEAQDNEASGITQSRKRAGKSKEKESEEEARNPEKLWFLEQIFEKDFWAVLRAPDSTTFEQGRPSSRKL